METTVSLQPIPNTTIPLLDKIIPMDLEKINNKSKNNKLKKMM